MFLKVGDDISGKWNGRCQSREMWSCVAKNIIHEYLSFPGGLDGKESVFNAGDLCSDPWVGKIPWRREWLPTPVLLPGKFNGQRKLVGCSLWGLKESDMTERLNWRRRHWRPTPVLLPGESHGLRSLVGYSPWGHQESDTTERLNFLIF